LRLWRASVHSFALMAFEDNKVLFGHDSEEQIVAAEFDENTSRIGLFIRERNGANSLRDETLRPFLWADREVKEEGCASRKLAGDLPLGWLVECESWADFAKLRGALKSGSVKHFALSDPVQQFLLATGKTLFKGMEWSDLRRMQIALDGQQSIGLADNTGWTETIGRSDFKKLNEIIAQRDPDVIEGHDLFKKILPALAAHARNAKVKLTWGRDGSVLTSRASRLQVAEKTITYPKYEMHGRHFVDTYLLAQVYDVSARTLESYELADVAAHLHIGRQATDATDEEDAKAGKPLASQDATIVRELVDSLGASYFQQAKIFPYNYQDVTVRGQATKIDSLFLREYLRQGHSIPDFPKVVAYEGGYTDIFFTGVARKVWHCDVASLYPSVMLGFDVFPAQDKLGIFRGMLTDLRKFRLEAKQEMRVETVPAKRAGLQALQTTFKILINAMYGYMGFSQAHFADYDAAAKVTQTGRELLKKMVGRLRELGAEVIEIDTDGIYFVPPKKPNEEKLQRGVAEVLPAGIEVEFDEQYAAMFSYKAKNYALLTRDGELIIRGGAFKSRGLEKFQRVFLEKTIRFLMDEKPDEIEKMRVEFEQKIRNREWSIEWLMKTDTLQESLAQYSKKIEGSSRNRAAAYELALKSGKNYQPGDQVSYYITGTKKNVSAYENSKLVSEWKPAERDENVEYYAAKLNDLMKKFAEFVKTGSAKERDQMSFELS
jgi:DNA polymerase I